ncbi:MAG: hypothetical protein ABR954_07405 [Dehalococcoidales bacterium]
MPKKIGIIGTPFPSDDVEFVSLDADKSLLDFDISVFNPDISEFYNNEIFGIKEYLGKPCLDDSKSFKLKEALSHWQKEILEAIRAGKTIFILLNKLQEVYVATGTKTFSGTGRNRQATRHVAPASNYELIPGGIEVANSEGTSMKLHGKDNILATYWTELEPVSEFRILLSGEGIQPLITTKTGDKTVGAYIKYKDAPGTLILLPYINFEGPDFVRETKAGDETWTRKAIQTSKQFITAIIGIDNTLKEECESTTPPEWIINERYILQKELQIKDELQVLDQNIDTIQKQKEQLLQVLNTETEIKRLLYEKGTPLEAVIIKSLRLIGYKASRYRGEDSEFDVVFESEDRRLIGEAEGKDKKAINIDKLRQLEMNIQEDYARDEVTVMAKGVLFGNAYRLLPPEGRSDFFTEKCVTAAKTNNIALVKTTDLFHISKYLSSTEDKEFAKKCRKSILDTNGIVSFPDIPEIKIRE